VDEPGRDGEQAIAEQIAYYRARAAEYDHEFQGAHAPALVAALARSAPRGRVLELACGTGAWTESLITHPVDSILAVDAAPEMLALHARRIRDPRVTRERADLFHWSPTDRYDFVTFAFWISHVPPARFDAFWEMFRQALAPQGRSFFIDQDERGLAFEQPSQDSDYPTVPRQLQSGETMTAIKVYHRPDELSAALAGLGWSAHIEAVPGGFFWGEAVPRSG
jgi:demethylmenaquinone methyltransferase/2-methoxy-6-polyprenyl-1,4-benzoquinol methylase